MSGFSFYRVATGYQGFTSHYKAFIRTDDNGRRHLKIFDRSVYPFALLHRDFATSTQQAKRLCDKWLQECGDL